jgi:hypothetical protein
MVAINLWVKYFPCGLNYLQFFTRYLVQQNPLLLHTAYNISQYTTLRRLLALGQAYYTLAQRHCSSLQIAPTHL